MTGFCLAVAVCLLAITPGSKRNHPMIASPFRFVYPGVEIDSCYKESEFEACDVFEERNIPAAREWRTRARDYRLESLRRAAPRRLCTLTSYPSLFTELRFSYTHSLVSGLTLQLAILAGHASSLFRFTMIQLIRRSRLKKRARSFTLYSLTVNVCVSVCKIALKCVCVCVCNSWRAWL